MRKMTILTMAALLAAAALAGCGDDDAATTEALATTTEAPTTTDAPATTEAPATTSATATTQAGGTTEPTAPPPDTSPPDTSSLPEENGMALFTSAFEDGGDIPIEFTCDGANNVPELRWDRVPAGTTSLALTVIDPDGGDWIHWIAWNIPPDAGSMMPDTPAGDLPDGTRQAENDYAQVFEAGDLFPGGSTIRIDGWDGPCPGPSPHRYVFTLYALSGTIDLPTGTPGLDILTAIEQAEDDGSLLASASIVGMYPPG